jgi:adenylate kinase
VGVEADGARGVRIVFLGPPGCGKGTQAVILAGQLGVPQVATGDMLREAVASDSELGRRVKNVMAAGRLVDDELMAEVVGERLSRPDAKCGFVLDGYPRTAPQAETLRSILERDGQTIDRVILFKVPDEVLVERARFRNREDDLEGVVRERLRLYREKTEPLVGRYRELGLLREIDGDRRIEEVTSQIQEALR